MHPAHRVGEDLAEEGALRLLQPFLFLQRAPRVHRRVGQVALLGRQATELVHAQEARSVRREGVVDRDAHLPAMLSGARKEKMGTIVPISYFPSRLLPVWRA